MGSAAKARATKEIFERKTYPAEWTVFHEGDMGYCAWYIESGKVLIFKNGPGGRTPLGALGPGEIFGELALIDDSPRMASAVTMAPSVLVPIARHYVQERIKKADPFISKLLNILVKNVRSITDRHVARVDTAEAVSYVEANRVAVSLDDKAASDR